MAFRTAIFILLAVCSDSRRVNTVDGNVDNARCSTPEELRKEVDTIISRGNLKDINFLTGVMDIDIPFVPKYTQKGETDGVFLDADKATLILQDVASVLKLIKVDVHVIGFVGKPCDASACETLARNRAQLVASTLQGQKVDASRMQVEAQAVGRDFKGVQISFDMPKQSTKLGSQGSLSIDCTSGVADVDIPFVPKYTQKGETDGVFLDADKAISILRDLASALKLIKVNVHVTGFVGKPCEVSACETLARNRAQLVASVLEDQGVDASNMQVQGEAAGEDFKGVKITFDKMDEEQQQACGFARLAITDC